MNVVKNQGNFGLKSAQPKKELIRKDASLGIRGLLNIPTKNPFTSAISTRNSSAPRYQFGKDGSTSEKANSLRCSMGPPLEPPRSLKRKLPPSFSTSSSRVESGGRARGGNVLASDSGALDTSRDFCTPRNRPSALRYISSSSRGGYSGNRSARSTSASIVEASVVLAISEGRGMARGEIGMAAVDLRHPTLVLCQFSDSLLYTHTLTKIHYFNPVEIIVPHTFCEGIQPNQLYTLIKDNFPNINLSTVQRRHYNDAAGLQQIQTLCAPQYNAVYLQVLHKFYALTAAAAVLKYVEYIQCIVFSRESLKIQYHSSENTMIIDVGTATQLELVQPLVPSAGPTCCLLGVLGPTFTVGGIRALRAAILQPPCNKEFIEERLDAVQDLIDNDAGLMTGLQDVIKRLSEIDKILFLCVESQVQNLEKMGEAQLNQTILLKTTMDLVPSLVEALSHAESNRLRAMKIKMGEAQLNQTILLKTTMDLVPSLVEALSHAESNRLRAMKIDFEHQHYKEISDRIRGIIQDDAHLEKGAMGSLQRCFAVKPEINGLLDVARRTYSELIEDIQKLVETLSERHELPLRLNQNALRGFHIVLPGQTKRRTFNVDLPDVFIQVQSSGASTTMTTAELVILDQQAKESLTEIQKMSNIVVGGLLSELRPFMSSLYKLCENVAELDILIALAHASTVGSYIRPEFSNYLDIRNSVHPLLDYNSQKLPVPNDIYASPENNFTIITGPNMGGKSIYIKQIAVMHIMAQLGCFLPATKAVLRLSDRVFSRIGFNDSVELNASTYVLEMKEMQHILKGLTPTSLVIIDELCRGTSTEEGTSIAWAICEELLASDAFTFFTTHFMYLTRLQDLYFNVVNLHTLVTEETVSTQNECKRLTYKHKIEAGVTEVEHYGLSLASRTNLPEDTVKLAQELAELIARSRKPQQIVSNIKNYEKLLYDLNANIRRESRKVADPEPLTRRMLIDFKNNNPNIIERLKLERNLTKSSLSEDIQTADRSMNILNNLVSTSSNMSTENNNQPLAETAVHKNHNNKDNPNKETNHEKVKSSSELLSTIIHSSDANITPNYSTTKKNNNVQKVLAEDTSNDEKMNKKKGKFRPPLKISDSDGSANINRGNPDNVARKELETIQRILNTTPVFEDDSIAHMDHDKNSDTSIQLDKELMNKQTDLNLPYSLSDASSQEYAINLNSAVFDDVQLSDEEIQYILNNNNLQTVNEEVESFPSLPSSESIDIDGNNINKDRDAENTDIAEAQTQVIEETSSQSDDELPCTVDEELMRETIAEISEDVQCIVLTPPAEFRDF